MHAATIFYCIDNRLFSTLTFETRMMGISGCIKRTRKVKTWNCTEKCVLLNHSYHRVKIVRLRLFSGIICAGGLSARITAITVIPGLFFTHST